MNYIINDELLEWFKKSLKLNKAHAQFIIDDAEQAQYVLSKREEELVQRQKEIIENADIVLDKLDKLEKEGLEVI